MNRLLLTRLRRSLMRTKMRVMTVVLLITLTVYAGIVFSEHNRNATSVYEDFYVETNLADLIVVDEVRDGNELLALCSAHSDWTCEARLTLDGQSKHVNSSGEYWLQSQFHGIESGIVSGTYAIDGSMNPGVGEIVVDAHVSKALELKLGDSIDIGAGSGMHSLTIVGIANHPLHLWYAPEGSLFPADDSMLVGYLDADVLAQIAGYDAGARNTLHIDLAGSPAFDLSETAAVDEGAELGLIREGIIVDMRSSGLEGDVIDRGSMNSPELLRLDLEGSKKSTPFILVVLLCISGLVISVSLDRLVKSQSREIAMLRTIGVSGGDIMTGYLLMPLILAVPGVMCGVLLGLSPIGSEGFTTFYFEFLGIPVVKTNHYPDLIFALAAGTIFLTFLFGIRPAIKAAKMQPLEVLGQSSTRRPNPLLVALTASLPPAIGLAFRSTFRKPGRLFVTLIALALSMVILGGTMMLMATFTDLFDEALDKQENWHAQALFRTEKVDAVESWAQGNTSTYELFIREDGNMSGDNRRFNIYGFDYLIAEDSAMHRFNLVSGEFPISGQNKPQVLIDEGMSILLKWQVGDTVSFDIGSTTHVVVITGTVIEIERGMYFHRADLIPLVGYEANGLRFTYAADVGIAEELRNNSFMIVEKSVLVEGFQELLKQQESIMRSTYLIGGLLAVAILFNTLLMNLTERDAELATLRVLGASRKRLAWILTIEHAFIGLIGGIAGAVASVLMLKGMAMMMTTWEFYIPLSVDLFVTLQIIGFVLIAALLTTPFGIWRIGRMNLLEVVARHED